MLFLRLSYCISLHASNRGVDALGQKEEVMSCICLIASEYVHITVNNYDISITSSTDDSVEHVYHSLTAYWGWCFNLG